MSIPKEILKQYDVKLIDRWTPPKEGEDIRPAKSTKANACYGSEDTAWICNVGQDA